MIKLCLCPCVSGTAALEEDAQILKVIEAYCTSAKTRQTLNSSEHTHTHTNTNICIFKYIIRHYTHGGAHTACCLIVNHYFLSAFSSNSVLLSTFCLPFIPLLSSFIRNCFFLMFLFDLNPLFSTCCTPRFPKFNLLHSNLTLPNWFFFLLLDLI